MNAVTVALLITIALVFLIIGYCVKRCKKPTVETEYDDGESFPAQSSEEHTIEVPAAPEIPSVVTPISVDPSTVVKSDNALKPEPEAPKADEVKTEEKPKAEKKAKATKTKKEPKAAAKKPAKKAAPKVEVKVEKKPRGRKKKEADDVVIKVTVPSAKPGRKPRKKV